MRLIFSATFNFWHNTRHAAFKVFRIHKHARCIHDAFDIALTCFRRAVICYVSTQSPIFGFPWLNTVILAAVAVFLSCSCVGKRRKEGDEMKEFGTLLQLSPSSHQSIYLSLSPTQTRSASPSSHLFSSVFLLFSSLYRSWCLVLSCWSFPYILMGMNAALKFFFSRPSFYSSCSLCAT